MRSQGARNCVWGRVTNVFVALSFGQLAAVGYAQITPIEWPQPIDLNVEMMEVRQFAQLETAPSIGVFHDFEFTEGIVDSRIHFLHRIVDDAGKNYKAVHYDHGNGVLAGDVDGDGLLDLYFVNQQGRNELWRNIGGGRFEDATAEAGVGLEGNVFATASFADIDNDSDQDLYVTTVRTGNHLLLNDGKGVFSDITALSGLGYEGHSSGAVFFDYDNDGLLDLFLANVGVYTTDSKAMGGFYVGFPDAFLGHNFPQRTERSLLYKNLGGNRFRDVSDETRLVDTGWSGDATFTDFNDDLYPDLYVLNMQGDDHYWENQGGRSFRDATDRHFPKNPWGAMGIKFFDWNNDSLMDLMLTDMHSDMSREVTPGYEKLKSLMTWTENDYLTDGPGNNIFGNAFWQNQGKGRFTEISDQVNAESYWPWGISVGDLNADGWEDVFIASSMNFPFRYGVNTLLLNDQGKVFRDSEFIVGVEPRTCLPGDEIRGGNSVLGCSNGRRFKKPWFELDCAAADSDHRLCRGARPGRYLMLGSVGTRSSVLLDLDQDGDLDIVTNEFNDRPQVLISNLGEKRDISYIQVDLTGTVSNRDGLGSTVEVFVGDRVLTKYHDGKSGYLSQSSSLPLYFGLGDSDRVDRIEVRWPSGIEQTVGDEIELNTTIEIREPVPGKR